VQRGAKRLLAGGGAPTARYEQFKRLVEPVHDLVDRQYAYPGRGQFQRQWDAVQSATKVADRARVVNGQLEPRSYCACAVDEQLCGGRCRYRFGSTRGGHVEGRYSPGDL